jgi:NAD(P)-dependent dehydrogenase (short-subunit alcohol dehydrogenase family)
MPVPPVALITAGSAGLGAATARLFAENGIRAVVNYSNNVERAEKLVEELRSLSSLNRDPSRQDFLAIRADLAKRDEINQLVDEVIKVMGRLDIVFSNGGWTRLRDLNNLDDNVDEDDWDRCFNMNVKSHLWLMHAAQPHLAVTEGAFITTASLAGVKVSGSSLVSTSLAVNIDIAPVILTLILGILGN